MIENVLLVVFLVLSLLYPRHRFLLRNTYSDKMSIRRIVIKNEDELNRRDDSINTTLVSKKIKEYTA